MDNNISLETLTKEEQELLRAEYRRETGFSSSFMFGAVLSGSPEICRKVLETLLRFRVDRIRYVKSEETMKLHEAGKGVRLDVYAADSDRVFDIEMQTTNGPGLKKRGRYYLSAMDGDALSAGEDYTALKETYVIFICLNDPFPPRNRPEYSFERRDLLEPELVLGDNTHIVRAHQF